jgi:hypothetical protein
MLNGFHPTPKFEQASANRGVIHLSQVTGLANWLIGISVAKRTSTKSESKPDNTVVSIRQENHP